MEILPASTSNSTAVGNMRDSSRIKLVLTGNPMWSRFRNGYWEYRKASLASLDVSVLDRLHYELKNVLRRFIYESNPNDAGNLRQNTSDPTVSVLLSHTQALK
ncbi:hypothetical protein Tco_1235166 [Tanacetum coccineum]